MPTRRALTVGQIADQLNEPIWRVQYILKTRNIEPEAVAGHIRVFPSEAVEQVAEILREIDRQAARAEEVCRA
jgi:hypothetical protein